MSEPIKKEQSLSFMDKIMEDVRGFGLRIVVHVSAFFCAGVVVSFVPSFAALGMYVGLICLVARETRLQPDWLVPAGLGVCQVVLSLALGLPLTEAVFWGGAQAWVQRLFMKRFSMGTEWGTAVFLVPLALKFLATSSSIVFLLGSFALISVLGMAFWELRTKLEKKKQAVHAAKEQMAHVASTVAQASAQQAAARLAEYKASIAKLRTKQLLLPKSMQTSTQALIQSAEAIVLCMQEDKRDTEPGEKFLRRYLPATHSVLENYCRLAGSARANSNASEDIDTALQNSKEVLVRLEQAFSHEHKSLLRNDIDDFSADLKVLDTLLKMEGR